MMGPIEYRKESSERSDDANWVRALLKERSGYTFESIEGCNQNASHVVTHLIERARVKQLHQDSIIQWKDIIALEGRSNLQRKLNFAACFGLPLSYVLYCNETQQVHLLNIHSVSEFELAARFDGFGAFAEWIAGIKGWSSSKSFREMNDLPEFDRELRKAGTPWPTNIDCFICDDRDRPLAVLEFQNARNTRVSRHCNNDFLLCKMAGTNSWGRTVYHDDIRRWTSQEILRVQSGLRYFIITWSQNEEEVMLKEVDRIALPYFPKKEDGIRDWNHIDQYKRDMHQYVRQGRDKSMEQRISNTYRSFTFTFDGQHMHSHITATPLSLDDRTFPSIYYKHKELIPHGRTDLAKRFSALLGSFDR